MTQSGPPGAPPPGGTPPAPPPQAPPPPPNWQSTPQPPAPPPAAAPSPMAQQMSALSANLMDRTPVAGPAGFYYADVPNRAIAYIIDAIIIAIVDLIIGLILFGILGSATTFTLAAGTTVNLVPLLIVAIVGLAVNAGYFVYTWVYMRGTIGMKALGMQIGNETDGATITMNQALTRWVLLGAPFGLAQLLNPWPGLGIIISLLSFAWLIALLVTTAQSPTKQGLHDRYAHTMVVKAARAVG
jgi:uncharacterized RDD family membrane protein YckC